MFKRKRELDEVFDDCLQRLAQGEAVKECVGRYPEFRDDLFPLLQTASATMGVASSITYRPEAKARGLNRLTSAIAERSAPEKGRSSWLSWVGGWRPRLASPLVIGLAAAVLATGTAFGASVASEDSVPGEPLYRVKTAKEAISLMMPKSELARAKEYVHLAAVRGEEMRRLIDRGRYDQVEVLVVRMVTHLNESAIIVGVTISTNPMEMPFRPPRRRQDAYEIMRYLQRESDIFQSLFQMEMLFGPTMESARVRRLMLRSELMYRSYIASLESSGAPPLPFWITAPPPRVY